MYLSVLYFDLSESDIDVVLSQHHFPLPCKDEYFECNSNEEKDAIVRDIVNAVIAKKGRFLQRVHSSKMANSLEIPSEVKFVWVLASADVVKIKVKQCFRDLFKKENPFADRSDWDTSWSHHPEVDTKTKAQSNSIPVRLHSLSRDNHISQQQHGHFQDSQVAAAVASERERMSASEVRQRLEQRCSHGDSIFNPRDRAGGLNSYLDMHAPNYARAAATQVASMACLYQGVFDTSTRPVTIPGAARLATAVSFLNNANRTPIRRSSDDDNLAFRSLFQLRADIQESEASHLLHRQLRLLLPVWMGLF